MPVFRHFCHLLVVRGRGDIALDSAIIKFGAMINVQRLAISVSEYSRGRHPLAYRRSNIAIAKRNAVYLME